MAKERFVDAYSQGLVNVVKSIVDTEAGVNYALGSHSKMNRAGIGLAVLVYADGKPDPGNLKGLAGNHHSWRGCFSVHSLAEIKLGCPDRRPAGAVPCFL